MTLRHLQPRRLRLRELPHLRRFRRPGVGPRQSRQFGAHDPGPVRDSSSATGPFHPMKGPMTTQSLRGMANHGPMHWRGDRTGGNDAASAQPNSGSFDEVAGFMKFNPAFQDLLGAAPSARRGHAGFCRFRSAAHLSAESDSQSRQFADCGPAGRSKFLHGHHQSSGLPLRYCQDLQRLPRAGPRAATAIRRGAAWFLWHRWAILLRERNAALQDSASAQPVSKGGKVRNVAGPLFPRSDPSHGRSSSRLRIPARWQYRHAVPLPRRESVRQLLRHQSRRHSLGAAGRYDSQPAHRFPAGL